MIAGVTPGAFRHEAYLYAGESEFLTGAAEFVRDAVDSGEPVLVVVSGPKLERLRETLGAEADGAQFADMDEVGSNPARIIPAWHEFVMHHSSPGSRVRGIGEPISAERTPDALVECQRHESLLNLAFADAPAWWLLCPYDTSTVDAAVVAEARRSHPFVVEDGSSRESVDYRGLEAVAAPFDVPLPEPPGRPAELSFEAGPLAPVREFVGAHAALFGLSGRQASDLVTAANELAANSLRHGGGRGVLRIWQDRDTVVCEIRDAGRFDGPLAGRERPPLDREDGRGLWLANHLCDLVQIRSFATGTVVRLHLRRRRAPAIPASAAIAHP